MNKLLGFGVAAALILSTVAAYNAGVGPVGPQGPQGVAGQDGRNGIDGANGANGKTVLGAVSGPEVNSPYFTINSVTTEYRRIGLNTATNTICAIKSPGATSTIKSASVYFKTSTTSASYVELAKATTPYATTTNLARQNFAAADVTVALVATSTTLGTYTGIIGPNQYIVAAMFGVANPGTVSPTGNCQAVFEVIQ